MTLPGVLDFELGHQMVVNCLITNNTRLHIPAGFVLYNMFPLTDKKIKIVTHLVGRDEINKLKIFYGNWCANGFQKAKKRLRND